MLYIQSKPKTSWDECRIHGAHPGDPNPLIIMWKKAWRQLVLCCGWQINLHIKCSIHWGIFDRLTGSMTHKGLGGRMPENKRADWRHHWVIYSVYSAQFSLCPTFHNTIKRNGMNSFQPRTSALHTKEKSIGLAQNPYKPLNSTLLSLVRYF